MSGELNLDTLLKTLSTKLIEGVFVFVTVPFGEVPVGLAPRMLFQESEAEAHGLAHEFPSRMITLNVHSSLEAVGFMAVIATALAEQGMGVNPVAGFYHDHLFIPEDRVQDALDVLAQLAA
jgi:hypothetical protein